MDKLVGMWDKFLPVVIQYSLKLVVAILIYFVGKKAAQIGAGLAAQAMTKAKVNKTLAAFFRNILYYGIVIFAVITALGQLGVQTTSFVALIGASGLAVGLALQGALANFAAGVMIILFQPFEVGDTIEAGGAQGTVSEIQIFNTVFAGANNTRIIVPNAKITAGIITILKKS